MAWKQRNSEEGKLIVPVLYRDCEIRVDWSTLQIISFLEPKAYKIAFDELLTAIGVSTDEETRRITGKLENPGGPNVKQMKPLIEAAFYNQDWPDVRRKADYLIKQSPGAVTSTIYRMQGVALAKEGEMQLAFEALDIGLALVSDREQRITLLDDYTTLLIALGRWKDVLRYVDEALRLTPNDVNLLVRQAQAFLQLERKEEASAAYNRAYALNPKDAGVQAIAKTLESAHRLKQKMTATPLSAQITSPSSFPVLAVGTTLLGRYEVIHVVNKGIQEHVYEVIDHQGYQHCWNCGSEQNSEGDEFCIDCGAELLNATYTMHEYPDTGGTNTDAIVISGRIMNTFVEDGHTYAIKQVSVAENTFPNGVHLLAACDSDVGNMRRSEHNEDSTLILLPQYRYESYAAQSGLFIVADGLNDHDNGQVASRMTISIVAERIKRELLVGSAESERGGKSVMQLDKDELVKLLRGAVEEANWKLCEVNKRDKTDMSSTITGFLVVGKDSYIVNVGDSRTYLVRGGMLYQLTIDHSLVGQLVASGQIEPDDVYTHPQRSQIFRSLGDKPNVQIVIFKQPLHPGDILLCCSDGLWEMVRNPQKESILNNAPDPQIACTQLIEAANANGGEENISVVVVFVH